MRRRSSRSSFHRAVSSRDDGGNELARSVRRIEQAHGKSDGQRAAVFVSRRDAQHVRDRYLVSPVAMTWR